MNLIAVVSLIPALGELNQGKGTNQQEFPILSKFSDNLETWWDNSSFNERVEIGGIAIHFYQMTANSKWNCSVNYSQLSKLQQSLIKFVASKKDDKYSMFYLPGLLKF